jgi:ferritin-like metal-binding protein YciE
MLDRTKLDDPHELFLFDLGAALTMEEKNEQMLGNLSEEAQDRQLKQQLQHHRRETQGQIRNIQQAFNALGEEPDDKPCLPIEAIEQEGRAKLKLADQGLKDGVILAGAAETEHHEIAVYENLIAHADAMGHDDVVALLLENLEQEQHTLGEVLRATLKRARQHAGAR